MRILLSFLIAAFLLTMAGCGSGEPAAEVPSADGSGLTEDAEAVAAALRSGDFDAVVSRFDDKLKSLLTAESLETAWNSVAPELGEYVGLVSAEGGGSANAYTVTVKDSFENGDLATMVTYDGEKKISGLFLKPLTAAPAGESTDVYKEESIEVGEYALAGLLTTPAASDGTEPIVVFIHGSGTSDMNETVGEGQMTPFKDLAHSLAALGISSIRYDKRYYDHPELAADVNAVTIETETIDDANAAVALAQSLGYDNIWIVGHSLGGMVAPFIASANDAVDGMVSMAGTLRNLAEVIYDQSAEAAAAADLTEDEKNAQLAAVKAQCDAILTLSDEDTGKYFEMPASYWRSLNAVQGNRYIGALQKPVLALQGSADFQVYPDVDYPLWQTALEGRDNAECVLFDGLNHLFVPTAGKRDVSDYAVHAEIPAEVSQTIADFIRSAD